LVWQAISGHAALQWEIDEVAGEVVSASGPTALVFWESVTWQALQDLGLSRIAFGAMGGPVWRQEEPPTAVQIRERWAARSRDDHGPDFEIVDADGNVIGVGEVKLFGRIPGESPDDFYARVAEAYRRIQLSSRAPTARLSELAGVPKSTAVAWVHQARRRGLLPKSVHGKAPR
jgi:hypothetical protein